MNSGDSFHFIESLGLIIVSHHSKMQQQNVVGILNEFEVNPFFAKAVMVLIDMRKAEIRVDSDEIKETSSLVFKKLNDKKTRHLN